MPVTLEAEPDARGRLILVPTPVGNLEDMTERAKKVLQSADLIAVEEAPHSRPLLAKFGCTAPVVVYHEQGNYQFRLQKLMAELAAGKTIALITSAGTPGISDPGFSIVREAIEQDFPVECLPGPTALIPALVVSGLPSHRFVFEGFLPHKGRQTRLTEIATEPRTTILYESPQRLLKLLEELIAVCGAERKACVVRELSKLYEEVKRGSLLSLLEHFSSKTVKGEIVVVLAGDDSKKPSARELKYRKFQVDDEEE